MTGSLDRDLRAYYDQDAPRRAARPLGPHRERWQAEFVALLGREGRVRVLELGCGPGRDTAGFRAAGLRPIGLDLSLAQARLAGVAGLPAVQGSLFLPPVRPGSFDAVWTMSALIHVPDVRFDEAMASIVATVRPGAPIGIGLWGGFDHEGPLDDDTIEPPRFFSHRSHDRLARMLARHVEIERFHVEEFDAEIEDYQFIVARSRSVSQLG